ncbi:unnamed protein product [Thelazia callipaeda]|uniref:Uncharacterized protein n=1 Tax=Thelazia callipaeda TaxID=103827 RepID=A0A0N5CVS6_THECL|nr:unnamed protein product [Thelazia callipaeda]
MTLVYFSTNTSPTTTTNTTTTSTTSPILVIAERDSSSRLTTPSAAVRIELRALTITRTLLFWAAINKNRMKRAADGNEI